LRAGDTDRGPNGNEFVVDHNDASGIKYEMLLVHGARASQIPIGVVGECHYGGRRGGCPILEGEPSVLVDPVDGFGRECARIALVTVGTVEAKA